MQYCGHSWLAGRRHTLEYDLISTIRLNDVDPQAWLGVIARSLRRERARPSDCWHLDEMLVRIAGRRLYLWRAVDYEGEVLDMLVQCRRDTRAALRLMRKLLRKQDFAPSY
jgi:transposase-like protein